MSGSEGTTESPRLRALRQMAADRPDDPRAHFGLALEHERAGDWEAVVASLQRYLQLARDEGNAYGRLGQALRRLGREQEARQAYRDGIDAAYRHGHPTMAQAFEDALDEL